MNQLEAKLHAIQNSIEYCKQQYDKETDPQIKEKIKHYIWGLEKEEQETLDTLNLRLEDITLTKEPKTEEK